MLRLASDEECARFGVREALRRAYGRREMAGRGPGGRRARGGGGGAPAYPTPDWHIESEDAIFSSHVMTSWPSVIGPTFLPESGYEPTDLGPTANGIVGVEFPVTTARARYSGEVIAGTHATWTWEIVSDPHNDIGYGNREYYIYVANNTSASNEHIVFPQQSNNSGVYTQMGQYCDDVWQIVASTPQARRQVLTMVQEVDGTVSVYRNGVLVGTGSANTPMHEFADIYLGSSFGSAPPQQTLKGSIYSIRAWASQPFTAAQVLAAAEERMTRFAIDPDAWLPSDVAGLTGWFDSRGKVGPSGAFWTGATDTMALWTDRSGAANNMAQGTSTSRPNNGVRINGRPTLDFDGTADFLSGGITSAYFTTACTIQMVVNIDAVGSNNATVYNNNCLIGDASGFWGLFLKNASGTYTLHGYIYDGATRTGSVPISLGTHLVQMRWDGATVELRVDDATVGTFSSGAPTNLTTAVRIGSRGTAGTYFDGQVAAALIRSTYLTGTDLTNSRADIAGQFAVTV